MEVRGSSTPTRRQLASKVSPMAPTSSSTPATAMAGRARTAPFQEATKNGLGLEPGGPRQAHDEQRRLQGRGLAARPTSRSPPTPSSSCRTSRMRRQRLVGHGHPDRSMAVERVDNFANGFLAIGARVVWALGWQPGADIVDALNEDDATMDAVFMTRYRSGVNPLNGWIGARPGLLRLRAHAWRDRPHRPRSDIRLPARAQRATSTSRRASGAMLPMPRRAIRKPPVIRDVSATQAAGDAGDRGRGTASLHAERRRPQRHDRHLAPPLRERLRGGRHQPRRQRRAAYHDVVAQGTRSGHVGRPQGQR